VTVVTTSASEGAYGVTVSSFASLSLNPLLVTVSISRSSQLVEHVRTVQAFAVSVLASDQQHVASYFATSGRRPEPAGFSTVSTIVQQTGAPIIESCLSWFDCTLEDILPGVIMRFLLVGWPRPGVALANPWFIGPANIED
jgi:flavin reductase (DIM6/NTAB) family NADH-FMN oxidoreductase RutF